MNTMIIRKERLDSDINFNDFHFDVKIAEYIKNGYENIISDCVSNIDKCKYIGDGRVESKFGNYAVSIEEISTGCKTVINVLCNRDKIVNVSGCGGNALAYLLNNYDNVTISSVGFVSSRSFDTELKLVLNNKEIQVRNSREYYRYWRDHND